MSNRNCQLVIGLPDTGKTTFLAALWHVVESEEVPGALKLSRLEGDREYITRIHEAWAQCQAIERTASGRLLPIELVLQAGNHETSLMLPDLSGETFRVQLMERAWLRDYADLAAEASGALVFIHPDRLVEPVRIDQADPLVGALDGSGKVTEIAPAPGIAWNEGNLPTQVQLVELLQFHQHGAPNLRRVAVVVSAWDRVSGLRKKPAEWLVASLPLFSQYLGANAETIAYTVYGVSAQGGDLGRDSENLLKKLRPSERIRLVEGENESNDITLPVRWLIES